MSTGLNSTRFFNAKQRLFLLITNIKIFKRFSLRLNYLLNDDVWTAIYTVTVFTEYTTTITSITAHQQMCKKLSIIRPTTQFHWYTSFNFDPRNTRPQLHIGYSRNNAPICVNHLNGRRYNPHCEIRLALCAIGDLQLDEDARFLVPFFFWFIIVLSFYSQCQMCGTRNQWSHGSLWNPPDRKIIDQSRSSFYLWVTRADEEPLPGKGVRRFVTETDRC